MAKAIRVSCNLIIDAIDPRSKEVVCHMELVDADNKTLVAWPQQRTGPGGSLTFEPCWLAMSRGPGELVNAEVIFEFEEKIPKKKKDPSAGFPTATPIDVK